MALREQPAAGAPPGAAAPSQSAQQQELSLPAMQLGCRFYVETLAHAKDKRTLSNPKPSPSPSPSPNPNPNPNCDPSPNPSPNPDPNPSLRPEQDKSTLSDWVALLRGGLQARP